MISIQPKQDVFFIPNPKPGQRRRHGPNSNPKPPAPVNPNPPKKHNNTQHNWTRV